MPRLHRQLYRGLFLSASMALRHSSLASRPATELKLLSFPPATHCLIVRYLVLHACSFRHCSLALTQSIRVVLARRFSSAEDSASGNTSGIDEKRIFLLCVFVCLFLIYHVLCGIFTKRYDTTGRLKCSISLNKTSSEIRSSARQQLLDPQLLLCFHRFVTLFTPQPPVSVQISFTGNLPIK